MRREGGHVVRMEDGCVVKREDGHVLKIVMDFKVEH